VAHISLKAAAKKLMTHVKMVEVVTQDLEPAHIDIV
jgi:hypothetical protein